MNENVDHWLDSFEKSHKKYIIMPSQSLNSSFLEESFSVTVWSPPDFINRENETRCYLNATFQFLYFNVLFRQLILNVDLYTRMNVQGKSQHFVHNFQKIMIMMDLQKYFGEIYLGGGKFYWSFLYFGKYKDKLSDGCRWIWGVII